MPWWFVLLSEIIGPMDLDVQGMCILDSDACLDLLATVRLGRIALTTHALPMILPVMFTLVDRDLIFNVRDGVLASAGRAGQIVCFQADCSDPDFTRGWSVSAIGKLVVVEGAALRSIGRLDLGPWACAPDVTMRLTPQLITGRMTTDSTPAGRDLMTEGPSAYSPDEAESTYEK